MSIKKKSIEGIKQHIEFLKSCIEQRKKDRAIDIQALATARVNNVGNAFGKHPDKFIEELEQEIKECEGKIVALQFTEGQKTYRVTYQRNGLIFQMGSILVQAHSPELAMQMVNGAISVQEHEDRGINDLKNQISQLGEWL